MKEIHRGYIPESGLRDILLQGQDGFYNIWWYDHHTSREIRVMWSRQWKLSSLGVVAMDPHDCRDLGVIPWEEREIVWADPLRALSVHLLTE